MHVTVNGHFLKGHRSGFEAGSAAGWKAGYLRALQDTGAAPVGPTPEMTGVEYVGPVNADLNETIEDLRDNAELSVLAFNSLSREGIDTVGKLAQRTEAQLLDIRNFGDGSLKLVKKALERRGLALKDYSQETYD